MYLQLHPNEIPLNENITIETKKNALNRQGCGLRFKGICIGACIQTDTGNESPKLTNIMHHARLSFFREGPSCGRKSHRKTG